MLGKSSKQDKTEPPVIHKPQLPSTNINFEADAGVGLEGADKDSYAIPFLVILQPLSPQVSEKTVEGAEAGMVMNSVTNELYKEIYVVPCAFQRRWVRWAAREVGGGYKGEFTTPDVQDIRARNLVKELDGKLFYPAADGSVNPKRDDRLADTRNHFVIVVESPDADFGYPAVLALGSTGIKHSKNFLSRIESIKKQKANGERFTPPSFSHVYKIKTVQDRNEKGVWWTPNISMVKEIENAGLYGLAKAFNKQVNEGRVDLAHDSVKEETTDSAKGF